jgi:DNA-binding transcriptional ArsR family regulator
MASKKQAPRTRRRRGQRTPTQTQIAKALSHPLRVKLLNLLNEGVASPKALAEQVDESLSLVSYHIRILRELDCIELVETAPRRGALEHFYRPLTRAHLTTGWDELPRSVRTSISATTLDELFSTASAALEQGTFDGRSERHLSVLELELDEAGWDEVNEMLEKVRQRATELQEARRSDRGEGVRSQLALAHFERARRNGNG